MVETRLPKLLKPSDVSRILNCSTSYIYKLADAGLLPCIRFSVPTTGKRKKETVRFYPQDVEIFQKDHYSIT
jgi:hypothetical protein